MTLRAQATGDTTIAGLPAEVVADLAREALHGSPDSSEAALATLTTLAAEPGWDGAVTETVTGTWAQLEAFASGSRVMQSLMYAIQDLWPFVAVATVVTVCVWFVWGRTHRAGGTLDPSSSHGRSPHRRAYGEAVTLAAQLLSKGEGAAAVSRTSGLARDLVSVVGSRRLVPAPADGSAATEASSGRKTRGARATPNRPVLK